MRYTVAFSHPPGCSRSEDLIREHLSRRTIAGRRLAVREVRRGRLVDHVDVEIPGEADPRVVVRDTGRQLIGHDAWCTNIEGGETMRDETKTFIKEFLTFGFFLIVCFLMMIVW